MKSAYALVLLICLSLTIHAQYSFVKYLGTADDERPYGMRQTQDGFFYVFGSRGSENHIIKLNQWGNSPWQLTYNENSAGDYIQDMVESPDGDLLFGGIAQWQIQSGNARITEVSKTGNLLFDTIYRAPSRGGSEIKIMIKEQDYFTTLGIGQQTDQKVTWLFQKYDYNLKRVSYKFTSGLEGTKVLAFIKDTLSSGYSIWGERLMLKIDSNGTTTHLQDITDGGLAGPIIGVVQNANGTYTTLAEETPDETFSYFIQLHDNNGKLISRKLVTNRYEMIDDSVVIHSLYAINKTADGEYILAGYDFRLLDSNFNEVWFQPFITESDSVTIKAVAQAQDGGFYGYGLSHANFDTRNYDFFVFKTTPKGIINTVTEPTKEGSTYLSPFQIYPNPSFSGVFTISNPTLQSVTAAIFDASGKKVLQTTLSTSTIDLSAHPNGLYYIRLTDSNGVLLHKQSIINLAE